MKRRARVSVAVISGGVLGACATSGDLSLGSFPSLSLDSSAAGASSTPGGVPMGGASSEATNTGGGATGGAATGGGIGLGGLPSLPACEPGGPLPAPSRRFDFSSTGSEVTDLMGGPPGQLVGSNLLDGSGQLTLDGDAYVDLPNGILGSEDSVTIMLWATPRPGPAFWRIFDFGTSSEGEDPTAPSVGTFYIALTPETGFDPSGLALLIGRGGPSSEDRALTAIDVGDRPIAVSVVLNGADNRAQLYFAGEVVAETPLSGPLSEIDDVNSWLGRSQYAADPNYQGLYDELRVYESALSACEVSALTALGPDDLGM